MTDTPPSGNGFKKQATSQMAALEAWMAPLFAKAPHIPAGGRQTIASIVPWLALIFGILGILGVLSALTALPSIGYISQFVPTASSLYPSMVVALTVGGIASVLSVMAFKPLSARRKRGWNLIFYAEVLSAVSAVIDVVFGYGNLMSVVFVLIGFWLLFEIRSLYS